MTAHVWLFSRVRAPRSIRKGVTGSWPAVVLLTRFNGAICGMYLRVGPRALLVSRMPK